MIHWIKKIGHYLKQCPIFNVVFRGLFKILYQPVGDFYFLYPYLLLV